MPTTVPISRPQHCLPWGSSPWQIPCSCPPGWSYLSMYVAVLAPSLSPAPSSGLGTKKVLCEAVW